MLPERQTKQIVAFAILPKLLKIVYLFDACASHKKNMYVLAGRSKMLIVTPTTAFPRE
jgi:hypothetical protein